MGTKKAGLMASKGGAKASPSSEYDSLEYVTPLTDEATNRPTSSLGTNLFTEDRYQRAIDGRRLSDRHLPCLSASALRPHLNHLQVPPIFPALASADP